MLKNFWKTKVDMGEIPEKNYEEKDEDSLLLDKIMELPVKYIEVLYLYYYEEYSLKEIASILQLPLATVGTRLSRGRKILKTMLKGEFDL